MSKDSLRRFIFENKDIRGAWVSLDTSIEQLLVKQQHYSPAVKACLSECLAASVLLSSTIKIDGRLSLQIRGVTPIKLLLAETLNLQQEQQLAIRGIVRMAQSDDAAAMSRAGWEQSITSLPALLGANAQLLISMEPQVGARYQSIVNLQAETLAENLQHYFQQSEQIDSYFHIAHTDSKTVGFMLQRLPPSEILDPQMQLESAHYWQHCLQLSKTLRDQELLSLDDETLLYRLFHQEALRLFDYRPICFRCGCSQERTARALHGLGQEQVMDLLEDKPTVEVGCQFCGEVYVFDTAALSALFGTISSNKLN